MSVPFLHRGRRSILRSAPLAFACVAPALAGPVSAQESDFHDDFEGAALDPFWTPFATSGRVIFPSLTEVHGGSQSLELATDYNTGQKNVGVRHVFATPTCGSASAWLYDTGADVGSSNYLNLVAWPFSVGTLDYDISPDNGGSYVFSIGGGGIHSGVDRTEGWHHFVITSTPVSATIEIDGAVIYTGPGGSPFAELQLEMHGPSWRPAWTSYWDDFAFENLAPASWTNYGSGFPGTHGVPSFTARSAPALGTTVTLDLGNSYGKFALATLLIGYQAASIPTGKGGELLVVPTFVSVLAVPPAGLALAGSLPDDPSLAGFELFLQALELDPGAARGVSFTPGLQLILGY